MSGSGPVRVFLSYAHEDHKWRDDLLNQLGGLRHDDKLVHFDDRQIAPGEEWDARIKAELAAADIVVLLLSPPFVGSGYCHRVELRGAIARAEAGQAHLVPVVCDHIDLEALPIASRQCLPPDEQGDLKPLTDWPNPNVPLARIAARIRELVGAIGATRASGIGGTGIWRQPTPPTRCFGRAGETERLVRALVADPACAAVVFGGPGIGKTTVTLEAACHPDVVGRFGERRCVVPLEKAAGADALVAALLEALGLRQGGDPWGAIEAALRAGPALVVLDNLETPWQADERGTEERLARLAAITGVRLLASIRSGAPPARPRWGVRFEVDRLPDPYDRELLLDVAGEELDGDPLLARALAALDGVPLAIELFAAAAAGVGSLGPLWAGWEKERAGVLRRGGAAGDDRLASLAASIRLSLDSPRMTDAGRRLDAMLGRLPDGLALEDAAALLPGEGDDAAARLLKARLARPVAGRVRMLAPVREHAAGVALGEEDAGRLAGHFVALAGALPEAGEMPADPALALRARAELANVEALLPGAGVGPGDAGWLWINVGDARVMLGSLALAARDYEEAHRLFAELAASDPGNAGWQRDLSVSWNKLGDVRRDQGDFAGALQAYEAGRVIAERLAGSDPSNAGWQRDLSVSWERVGGIRERKGDRAGALEAWRRALAVSLPLAKAHSDSVEIVTAAEVHVEGVARNLPADDMSGREELAAQARNLLALLQPLADAGRLDAQRAGWADDLKQVLAGLRGKSSSGAKPGNQGRRSRARPG